MKDHLTAQVSQAQALSSTHLLTAQNDLYGQLQSFLLFAKVEGLSPATIRDYRYKINRFVQFSRSSGIIVPKDVTPPLVRLFLLGLQERNAPGGVIGYYKSVKRFFNWLIEEGLLDASPMANIKAPKVQRKIVTPFNIQHISNMLSLCDPKTFFGARDRAIVLTLLDTGLRRRELADIQLADIDLDREVIKVMGKGARERVVRIGQRTQKALLTYLLMRDDKLPGLWVNQWRTPLTDWGIAQVIKRLGERAGVHNVRCSPHTFRHTFATQALINGAGEFNVQSLLGHSDLRMTRRYSATLRSEHAVEAHKKASPVDNMRL